MILVFIVALANVTTKFALFALNTYMLRRFRKTLWPGQRIGLSVVGGGCLLTMPLALDPLSGFNLWAPIVLVVGMLTFLWSSSNRMYLHDKKNEAAREGAKRHLIGRGKL